MNFNFTVDLEGRDRNQITLWSSWSQRLVVIKKGDITGLKIPAILVIIKRVCLINECILVQLFI